MHPSSLERGPSMQVTRRGGLREEQFLRHLPQECRGGGGGCQEAPERLGVASESSLPVHVATPEAP